MRLEFIQGLRALAVIVVILSHFKLLFPNGWLGVDVFFVISGFVITRLILRELSSGEFSLGRFYRRRFLRLFPALAGTVLVTLMVSSIFLSSPAFGESFLTGILSLVGVQNGAIHVITGDYFSTSSESNAFLHLWSLAVEEQFYLVFPILLLALFRLAKSRWSILLLIIPTVVSLLAFVFHSNFQGVSLLGALFSYYSPVIRFWEFSIGASIALLERTVGHRKRTSRNSLIHAIALWALIFIVLLPSSNDAAHRTLAILVAVVLTGVLLHTGLVAKSTVLTSRAMRWIGDRSYSLYLVHWPIFVIGGFISDWSNSTLLRVVQVALTLVLGTMSYKLFETNVFRNARFLQLKSQALVFGLAAILVVSTNPMHKLWNPGDNVRHDERLLEFTTCMDAKDWCLSEGYVEADSLSSSRPDVFLVGDSNAAMLHAGLLKATSELELSLAANTKGSCTGFFHMVGTNFAKLPNDCLEFEKSVLHALKEASPSIVVMAFSDNYLDFKTIQSDSNRAEIERLVRGSTQLAVEISSYGHKVLVVRTMSNWNWYEPSFHPELTPPWLNSMVQKPSVNSEVSVGLDRALRGLDSISLVDLETTLCPNGNCTLFDGEGYVWMDANHITRRGSLELTAKWRSVIAEAAQPSA